jgi:methyl-accepting chemotaxis protein
MATQAATDAARLPIVAPAEQEISAHAVSGGFQLRYVARLAAAVACGAAAACALLYVLLARQLGDYAQNMTIISAVRNGVLGASILSALLQVVLTGAVVAALALFASHKIAGPTVRLTRTLGRVAQGALPGPVRFRRDDQVGTLEGHFNEVSLALRARHEALTRRLEEVRSAEARLRAALGEPEAREERQAAARQLRERVGELASLLAKLGGQVEKDPSD